LRCPSPKSKGRTQSPGTANTQQSSSANQQKEASTEPIPAVEISEQKIQAPRNERSEQQVQEDIDIQGKLAKFTKYLVVVGALQLLTLIGQAVVFYLTLNQIDRQANLMGLHAGHLSDLVAANNNAIAAKTSADALINSDLGLRRAFGKQYRSFLDPKEGCSLEFLKESFL
jgi:hypothetical protein